MFRRVHRSVFTDRNDYCKSYVLTDGGTGLVGRLEDGGSCWVRLAEDRVLDIGYRCILGESGRRLV